MKERRGPFGRTVGAVTQGLAGVARRRQVEREPRVVIYDVAGRPDLIRPDVREHSDLVETAERMLEIAAMGRPRRWPGRTVGDEEEEGS